MKIGYAQVSTLEQNLDLQIDALKNVGCEKIITDEVSGSVADRPGLKYLEYISKHRDNFVRSHFSRIIHFQLIYTAIEKP